MHYFTNTVCLVSTMDEIMDDDSNCWDSSSSSSFGDVIMLDKPTARMPSPTTTDLVMMQQQQDSDNVQVINSSSSNTATLPVMVVEMEDHNEEEEEDEDNHQKKDEEETPVLFSGSPYNKLSQRDLSFMTLLGRCITPQKQPPPRRPLSHFANNSKRLSSSSSSSSLSPSSCSSSSRWTNNNTRRVSFRCNEQGDIVGNHVYEFERCDENDYKLALWYTPSESAAIRKQVHQVVDFFRYNCTEYMRAMDLIVSSPSSSCPGYAGSGCWVLYSRYGNRSDLDRALALVRLYWDDARGLEWRISNSDHVVAERIAQHRAVTLQAWRQHGGTFHQEVRRASKFASRTSHVYAITLANLDAKEASRVHDDDDKPQEDTVLSISSLLSSPSSLGYAMAGC